MQKLRCFRRRLREFNSRYFNPIMRRFSRTILILTVLGFLFMIANPTYKIEDNFPITYAFVTMWPKIFLGVYESVFDMIKSIVHGGNIFQAIIGFFKTAWNCFFIPFKGFFGMF